MNAITAGFPYSLLMLLPVVFWVVSLYLILRFLRAIEAGVRAHARIAEALEARARQAFGERAT